MSIHRYWCFICQSQFQSQPDETCSECPICHQQAFEESDAANHPSQFEVYNNQPIPQSNPLSSNSPQVSMTFGSNNASDGQPRISILSMMTRFNNSPQMSSSNTPQVNINMLMSNALQLSNAMINSLPPNFYQSIDNLVGQLINSGNTYRPTTPQEIEALTKIQNVEECGVCHDQSEEKNGWKLKCGHEFHQSCLRPWMTRANTCPMCRSTI